MLLGTALRSESAAVGPELAPLCHVLFYPGGSPLEQLAKGWD